MTNAATAKSKRREADRLRKQKERAERKAAGAPSPGQVDLAVTEAISFVLAISLPAGATKLPADAAISVKQIVQTALRILVKRWRFDKVQAAEALQSRIGKRDEHSNPRWYPHFPSCEPQFWKDMSGIESLDTHVTPTGRVRPDEAEATQI